MTPRPTCGVQSAVQMLVHTMCSHRLLRLLTFTYRNSQSFPIIAQFFLTSPPVLSCPSHSFILAPSIYRSLETPVRQIHSFVSLGLQSYLASFSRQQAIPQLALCHRAGCTLQIGAALYRFAILNRPLRAKAVSVCFMLVSILFSLSLEKKKKKNLAHNR